MAGYCLLTHQIIYMYLCFSIDSRVTGIGNTINTLFVFVLFYIVPMVNHPG